MKKSLIALAVLAASGAAMAQSSVTLYGVVDLGVGKLDGQKVGMQGNSKVTNGASRIGFRGVEDLGGGLKVGFNFEQGINAENGATDLSRDANGNVFASTFQRQANVWIGGGWGTFKMGRALTPSYNGMAAWELLGAPNYSVVGNTFGYGANPAARNSSQFSYKTPSFGGFGVEVGYVAKGDLGANKFDLGLTYVNGPLGAGVSYNKVSGGKANYALGAKYNFGSFALAASYNDGRSWTGTLANGINYNNGRRTGFSLGGMVNFGAMSLALDVTRDTKREVRVGNVVYKGKKFTNGVVEFKYALSKRTFMYADYLRLDDTNNYGVGLRHNF